LRGFFGAQSRNFKRADVPRALASRTVFAREK
jgi:hypothetical protein